MNIFMKTKLMSINPHFLQMHQYELERREKFDFLLEFVKVDVFGRVLMNLSQNLH